MDQGLYKMVDEGAVKKIRLVVHKMVKQ